MENDEMKIQRLEDENAGFRRALRHLLPNLKAWSDGHIPQAFNPMRDFYIELSSLVK